MDNLKQIEKKKIINIILLITIPIYMIFYILFPSITIKISKNIFMQIFIISAGFYFSIYISKLKINKNKIKELYKNLKMFINRYILLKVLLMIIMIQILTNIISS